MRTGFFCRATARGSAQRQLQSRSSRLISRGHTSITSLLRPSEMVLQRHVPPSVDAPVAKRGNGATIRSAPTHLWQPQRRARQMLVGRTTTRISSVMAYTAWLQATSKSAPMRAAPIRSVISTVSHLYTCVPVGYYSTCRCKSTPRRMVRRCHLQPGELLLGRARSSIVLLSRAWMGISRP